MKKRAAPKKKNKQAAKAKTGWVIGSRSFEKISAVEGIFLKGDMRKRAHGDGSVEERRRTIIKAYRGG